MRFQLLCMTLALGFVSHANAQHAGDIFLAVEDNTIATGGINSNSTVETPIRVFDAEFGDSGFPGFTANPGFDSLPGTFDPDTRVGFNLLDGLRYWDGQTLGFAAGETLNISFLSLEVTLADEPIPGFDLAVQPNGGFHRHLNYLLQGAGVSDPVDGVYAVEMEMYSTDPMLASSDSFWLVFIHNATEEEQQIVADWIFSNELEAVCPADLDGDGFVRGSDLLLLLNAWGGDSAAIDLDDNGTVGGGDLLQLLNNWGECSG